MLHIGRRGFLKHESPGDPARAQTALPTPAAPRRTRIASKKRILYSTAPEPTASTAGSVAAASPRLGEMQAESSIVYGLEDILGEKQKDYANRSILVIGSGYSAATTVSSLAKLAGQRTIRPGLPGWPAARTVSRCGGLPTIRSANAIV